MLEIRSNTRIFTKTCLKTRMMIFKFFDDWVLKNAILFVLRL